MNCCISCDAPLIGAYVTNEYGLDYCLDCYTGGSDEAAELAAARDRIAQLEADLRAMTAQLYAEQSVMDDTLDMVDAPKCGDPFMPERITRVQMLADQRSKLAADRDDLLHALNTERAKAVLVQPVLAEVERLRNGIAHIWQSGRWQELEALIAPAPDLDATHGGGGLDPLLLRAEALPFETLDWDEENIPFPACDV